MRVSLFKFGNHLLDRVIQKESFPVLEQLPVLKKFFLNDTVKDDAPNNRH